MRVKSLVILTVILLFLVSCSKGKITGGSVTDTIKKEVNLKSNKCQDDDNGMDFKKRGVTKILKDGEKITQRMDECFNNILVEYYCSNGQIASQNFNCAKEGKTCYAGACK